jgi:hypothetical protein
MDGTEMAQITDRAAQSRTDHDPWRTIAELEEKLRERTAERDGAVAQQTATAEILHVISGS